MRLTATILLFTFVTVFSSATNENLEAKILERLDTFSTSEPYLTKATRNPEILGDLLEEKFSVEITAITQKRLKGFKKKKMYGWVMWDDGSAFKLSHEKILEVQFDTGYAGGFIALVEKDSLKVLHILITPEG